MFLKFSLVSVQHSSSEHIVPSTPALEAGTGAQCFSSWVWVRVKLGFRSDHHSVLESD